MKAWHAVWGLLLLCGQAGAVQFTVDSTDDAVDAAPGDGLCVTAGGACTLRAAIQEANALAGADVIMLPAGTYTLSLAGADEDAAATGDLDLRSELALIGAGPQTTRVAAGVDDRVFDVHDGAIATLAALAVADGRGVTSGGGIRNAGVLAVELCLIENNGSDTAPVQLGGGIASSGALAVTGCVLRNNQAGAAGMIGALGGALYNQLGAAINASRIEGNRALGTGNSGGGIYSLTGLLQISTSRIDTNSAQHGGGLTLASGELAINAVLLSGNTASGNGGGVRVVSGSATLVNATLSGNLAAGDGGGLQLAGGSVDLRNATISANRADSDANTVGNGGGVMVSTAVPDTVLTARNSLLANNTDGSSTTIHPDCSGPLSSQGYLLLRDASGCTRTTGDTDTDLLGADPLLEALADNGGLLPTHALAVGSPAIDAAHPDGCLGTADTPLLFDQRGHPRPWDGDGDDTARCDIGAYERTPQLVFRSGFEAREEMPPVW